MSPKKARDPRSRLEGRALLLEELRDLHLDKGEPTLREIARATSLSVSTVHSALRAEDGNPRWPVVAAIVQYLGGDVDRFKKLYELGRAEERSLESRAEGIAQELDVAKRVEGISKKDALTSSVPGVVCFWSYTHRDDLLEGGRIRRLAEVIANEYELLTGERLDLFVDKTAISWGDQWRDVINNALQKTALFIPVVTPLYLRSEECRREFVEFAGRAESVDAKELLLPILYAETPAIADVENEDEVPALVRETQYEDWRQIRLADERSQEYRTAVHRLASRLVDVVATVSARPLSKVQPDVDDTSGALDRIVDAEDHINSWQTILESLSGETQKIHAAVDRATEALQKSDSRGGGAKGRLRVLAGFAEEIREPSEQIGRLGNEFGESVRHADPGVQIVIRQLRNEVLSDEDAEQAADFFDTVRQFADSTTFMTSQVKEFVRQIDQVQSLSRVIRSPLLRMRSGLSAIIDAETVMLGWASLTRD